jgi:hypothetical protein
MSAQTARLAAHTIRGFNADIFLHLLTGSVLASPDVAKPPVETGAARALGGTQESAKRDGMCNGGHSEAQETFLKNFREAPSPRQPYSQGRGITLRCGARQKANGKEQMANGKWQIACAESRVLLFEIAPADARDIR